MSTFDDPLKPVIDLSRLRTEYSRKSLDEKDVDCDGLQQFIRWLNEAVAAKVNEPNAMTLATASREGLPTARIVLLKGIDHGELSFFTNYQSRKSEDLEKNPRSALVFWWPELERQVRIEGTVQHASQQESDDYFNIRPPAARLGAAASAQSQPIASRQELQAIYDQLLKQYPQGNVPRPAHWGGYRVRPTRFEFWQGRPSRLHDRIEYILNEAGRIFPSPGTPGEGQGGGSLPSLPDTSIAPPPQPSPGVPGAGEKGNPPVVSSMHAGQWIIRRLAP